MSARPLDGSVAVVTGASRGIGRSISLAFAAAGARVVACARDETDLNRLVEEIEESGGESIGVRCDVADDEDVARLQREAVAAFGAAQIVVNNAGAYIVGPFVDASLDDFRRLIDVNYLGVVRVIRAFLPGMLEQGSGRVINVASTAGLHASRNQSMYNGSKHAVIGLTRSLGLELAPTGVRVNAICPGFVDTAVLRSALPTLAGVLGITEDAVLSGLTQRVPIGRLLDPDEIAPLAVYLASAAADGVTGQTFTIDGGLIA